MCQVTGEVWAVQYLYTLLTDPNFAVVNKGLFILRDAGFLRRLSEMNDSVRGYESNWSCKRKEPHRFDARCSCAGKLKTSSGQGIRNKQLNKVGCTAQIRTCHSFGVSEEDLLIIASAMAQGLQKNLRVYDGCCINFMSINHTGHFLPGLEPYKVALSRTEDLVALQDMRKWCSSD